MARILIEDDPKISGAITAEMVGQGSELVNLIAQVMHQDEDWKTLLILGAKMGLSKGDHKNCKHKH